MQRSHVGFGLLALVSLLVLGWWLRSSDSSVAPFESVTPDAAGPVESRDGVATRPAEPSRNPERSEATPRRLAQAARTADAAALWIEGRLQLPEGVTPDESTHVLATGGDFRHGDEHRSRVAVEDGAEPSGGFRS